MAVVPTIRRSLPEEHSPWISDSTRRFVSKLRPKHSFIHCTSTLKSFQLYPRLLSAARYRKRFQESPSVETAKGKTLHEAKLRKIATEDKIHGREDYLFFGLTLYSITQQKERTKIVAKSEITC